MAWYSTFCLLSRHPCSDNLPLLGLLLRCPVGSTGSWGWLSHLGVPGLSGSSGGWNSGGESTGSGTGHLPVSTTSSGGETRLDGSWADLLNGSDLGLILDGLGLLGLWVAVEVKIDHDVPVSLTGGDGATETEYLTGQHPPNKTDGVTGLVVGWDGNIDELGWGVGIAKGDDWDVDVGSLLDGLGIGAWIGDDDEAWLLEGTGDVVGEVTWGETTGDGLGTGVVGKLQDSALTVWAGRDDTDVSWVVNGCDDAGSEDNLLPEARKLVCVTVVPAPSLAHSIRNIPGLADVDNVDSVWAGLPEVVIHVNLQVLGAKVALSCEEQLNVLSGGVEARWELGWGHLDGFDLNLSRDLWC